MTIEIQSAALGQDQPSRCGLAESQEPKLRGSERGSAYILVMLVMFVVTTLGMGLVAVTQTEALLASQERTEETAFYAAETGVAMAAARMLVNADYRRNITVFDQEVEFDGSAAMEMTDVIDVAPVLPILDAPCALCQINQGDQYFRINHSINSGATRMGTELGTGDAGDGVPIARRGVSLHLDVQPWMRVDDAFRQFYDDENEGGFDTY